MTAPHSARRAGGPATRGPGARLTAAIVAHAAAAGCTADAVSLDEQDWASATFVGVRQRIVFAVPPGTARTRWLAALPDADFPIPHHCLADLVAAVDAANERHVVIETLLLHDA